MTAAPENPGEQPPPDLHILKDELEAPPPGVDPQQPPDGGGSSDMSDEYAPSGEIFVNAPVTALGVYGDTFFYLDYLGQLAPVNNHTKDRMRGIFGGRTELLIGEFPTYNKEGNVSGWSQEETATAMTRSCADKGVWNAFEKVRGLGAWPDDENGVILHCGDKILFKGEWQPPGEIEGYVYPSDIRTPRPLYEHVVSGDASPANELLTVLRTWNWMRGDIDAYLLLGWICSAMFGGAMAWRPVVWMTGDAGTGKSSAQALIGHVFGDGALLQTTDTTEAAIRQFTRQATTPVAVDEAEAEADPRKLQALIKLARQAASGGLTLRGGADHNGQAFKSRNSFMFSSILVPSLMDQDISRIALLELQPLVKDSVAPKLDKKHWGRVGRALRTLILDNWDRLHETLELYRAGLARAGHTARGADQFGTLLAMADLVLHDDTPTLGRVDGWAKKLAAHVIDDQVEQVADWQRCLNFLFAQQLDVFRSGERLTVGRWIRVAAALDDSEQFDKATRALSSIGLRVYGRKEEAQLAIANSHDGLAQIFAGTRWQGGPGLAGVWSQATKRIPHATATGALSFDMVKSRCRKFPLKSIPDLFGDQGAPAQQAPHDDPNPEQNNDFV